MTDNDSSAKILYFKLSQEYKYSLQFLVYVCCLGGGGGGGGQFRFR